MGCLFDLEQLQNNLRMQYLTHQNSHQCTITLLLLSNADSIMHSELRLIEPVVEDTRMWVIF